MCIRAAGGSGGSATGGAPGGLVRELRGHRQEVCGLKWSFDEKYLASGGNDNKLLVWDLLHTTQQQQLHTGTSMIDIGSCFSRC